MSQPDLQMFLPHDDVAILPWYKGIFSQAFVALHPFFAIEGLDPAICDYGTLSLSANERPDDMGLLEWADQKRDEQSIGTEVGQNAVEDAARRFGDPIRWRTISDDVGFDDHRDLNRALRTNIGGLRASHSNPSAAARLVDHCARRHIFLPTEGSFQPLMEQPILELLHRCGLETAIVGDEFGEEEHRIDLTTHFDPANGFKSFPIAFPRRVFAEDRSLLIAVHWDSFFTLILATDARIAGSRISELFEGFWCNTFTSISWLDQPKIQLVE